MAVVWRKSHYGIIGIDEISDSEHEIGSASISFAGQNNQVTWKNRFLYDAWTREGWVGGIGRSGCTENPRVSVAARAVRRRWCGLLELLFAAMRAQSSNHSGSLVT